MRHQSEYRRTCRIVAYRRNAPLRYAAMATREEVELEFYQKFFIDRGMEPYPVQEEALGHIFRGENVLVTVPTGTGKTLLAKAGILLALRTGKTAIYTTPLRALTEEKFRELQDDFGVENVGFATGDYKVNSSAPIQVLVAEILWNRIYGDRVNAPADVVIMDEGHYFNDPERGYVWEQSIIGLDPRTQLVVLSATVGMPMSFVQWCYSTSGASSTSSSWSRSWAPRARCRPSSSASPASSASSGRAC
jgi:superfamily II RNA helicase